MDLVAGVDSSTQATKIVVVDLATGRTVREERAAHPPGTEVDPGAWWAAFAAAGGVLDGVAAISVGGQQHGMVLLDAAGEPVRDALLWNDTRSAGAARDLIDELGGPARWAAEVGTVPVASITATKLRWTARAEPEVAGRAARVLLPHDWLTWLLAGRPAGAVTDRGEASGTGYWSTVTGEYRPDLLRLAFGRDLEVPRVCGPGERAGSVAEFVPGAVLGAGTGDNMAAALGAGAEPGDVLVSIGTSGTVFATHDRPSADASGVVAGFADAAGGYLPLVATLNAARVLRAGADLLGVDLAELDRLALSASPGADGLVLLPYLEGERTPNRPTARGAVAGLTGANATPANLARAVVEGMLCGLADGLDGLVAQGVPVRRVLLLGGGSRSAAVRAIAPLVFGVPVTVLAPAEYVALGAARQAAWALTGEAPGWARPEESTESPPAGVGEVSSAVRTAYAAVRDGGG
ncbi:xylulokinase [Pseudonocardia eucalypti]|uniref:Xylulose kinase n=1 Tax=Pseudonocardia eucalypti TaxID=648755 RepID=A0ABP9PJQ5_9PSEU|nr:xylulokinase [Pseudonocardia eucalypti]